MNGGEVLPGVHGWDDSDDEGAGIAPEFQPNSPAGLSLPEGFQPTCEADFFKLFFTEVVVASIAAFTNTYAWLHILDFPSYGDEHGAWEDTNVEETYHLIALLLYMGLCRFPCERDYYRVTSLYHGNWARAMIPSRHRFFGLMQFFHVVDPLTENPQDRLRKIRYLYDHLKMASRQLMIPYQVLSVDERMIRSKGRFIFKQYLPKKPTKWGVKMFALCDVKTSYLLDFNIYTGQEEHDNGLNASTNAVLSLCNGLDHQGYVMYTDNYYIPSVGHGPC